MIRPGFSTTLPEIAGGAYRRAILGPLERIARRVMARAGDRPGHTLVTALAASEGWLGLLGEALTTGIIIRDRDGRVVHANRAAADLLGLLPAGLIGHTSAHLPQLQREDGSPLAGSAESWLAARRTGRPVRQVTARLQRTEGEATWFHLDHVPLLGSDGSVEGVLTSFLDITARKQTEEELRFQKSLHEALTEASADGILVVSPEGKVISYNQRFRELSGLPAEVLQAPSALAILDALKDVIIDSDQFIEQVLYLHGRPDREDWTEVRQADGEVREQYSAPVRSPDGTYHGRVWFVRDITARKRWEELLEHQALHDELTALPNRTLLNDRLQQAILASLRERRPLALLLMDLDGFKVVNDTLGHSMGDLLLQLVARRLRQGVRASDTVGRLGGDEFAFVLPATNSAQAGETARKLLAALSRPFYLNGQPLTVGASIGISLCPEHGTDVAVLLRRADVAMYAAKRTASGFAVHPPVQDPPHPDFSAPELPD